MKKNQAGQYITAQLNALADGTPVTSGTTSVTVIGDGTAAAGAGTVTHLSGGTWRYAPTQAETNFSHITFVFSNSLAATQSPQVYTENDADLATLIRTEIDTNSTKLASILADTGTDIPALIAALNDFNPATDVVANVTLVDTCTANTDMVVAPDNASISAILADTNELQTNQNNWLTADVSNVTVGNIAAIVSAVWNAASSGYTTAGTFGNHLDAKISSISGGGGGGGITQQQARDAMKLAASAGAPAGGSIDSILADILAEVSSNIPALISALHDFDPSTQSVIVGTNNDKSGYTISGTKTTLDALNDFDYTSEQVTVGTNNDKSGYSIAGIKSTLDDLNDFDFSTESVTVSANNDKSGYTISGAKTTLDSLNDFDPSLDTVARVTLVDTCTSNSDMVVAPDNATIASISSAIGSLNDLSFADIWGTTLSESYPAKGAEMTAGQSLYLIAQSLNEFSISGTTVTVRGVDGLTPVVSYTLDDETSPTSKTRA